MNKFALSFITDEGKFMGLWNVEEFHIHPDAISVMRRGEIVTYNGTLTAGFIQGADHALDDEYL